jgi:hypothetical protein
VAADVATFDGAPAVVLVVTTATGRTGYAVRRDCGSGPAAPLAGPLQLG